MRGRLPASSAPYVFGFVLSAFMSFIVSGIATARVLGIEPGVLHAWMVSWLSSWAVAFPIVLVVAPMVRRIVAYLVASPPSNA